MRVPSPWPERKAYESEALYEIAAFAVALLGLGIQAWVAVSDRAKPGAAQKLAQALYGPDRDQRLFNLAHERSGVDPWQIGGWALTGFGLCLLFWFKFQRAKKKDLAESQMKSPEGLRGCAHVVYGVLKQALHIDGGDVSVRVTIYRVTSQVGGEQPELEQVIDYVGAQRPTGMGRRFPIHVGIIGLTARSGDPQVANRKSTDENEYRAELVQDWGYTEEMATELAPDRKAFIAVPVKGEHDKVIGIVYADSNAEGAFDSVAEQFVAASTGIAAYIEERF